MIIKNIADNKFENGICARTAGNTMKAKSGPFRGISFIAIPVSCDIKPM